METARMDPRWRMERPWARKRNPVQKVTNDSAMPHASEPAAATDESNTLLQEQPTGHESTHLENTTHTENSTQPADELVQSRSASSNASTSRSSLSGKTIYEPQSENQNHPAATVKDVERLRNFIQYVLTIDYDVETSTSSLLPADRKYFLQIGRQFHDLNGETAREEQRLKLACKELELPAQNVMSMIKQFCARLESNQGIYDQDLLEYGKGEGDAVLATRLCLDKYVLVTRVVTGKKDRKALLRVNGEVWKASF